MENLLIGNFLISCYRKFFLKSCALVFHIRLFVAGTIKGLTSDQLEDIGCHIILGNTYHLALRPGADLIDQLGGLHNFMSWPRALLTDSGGFQMVKSLYSTSYSF